MSLYLHKSINHYTRKPILLNQQSYSIVPTLEFGHKFDKRQKRKKLVFNKMLRYLCLYPINQNITNQNDVISLFSILHRVRHG